jgi:hypothetical protein
MRGRHTGEHAGRVSRSLCTFLSQRLRRVVETDTACAAGEYHIPIAFVCAPYETWAETRKIIKVSLIAVIRNSNLPYINQIFFFTLQYSVYCPEFGTGSDM